MNFNFKNYIKSIEKKLFKGYKLDIFRGHKASNKRGAEKVIDDLYKNLDEKVKKAKNNLNQ